MNARYLALALAVAPSLGWAQAPGDAVLGQDLARRWCGGCHAVEARPAGPMNDAAPAFASIAARPDTTPAHITAFLQRAHAPMPDLALSAAEMADVAAYIVTLRR